MIMMSFEPPHGKTNNLIGETKGTVTAKLISAFVFATRIVQFLFYFNPKFQASSSCTGRFVSDLVGNHIDGFPTRQLIHYFLSVKQWFTVHRFCQLTFVKLPLSTYLCQLTFVKLPLSTSILIITKTCPCNKKRIFDL